ncbi:hypothetical protein VCV18_002240 [Metarhizium anisopliae]
MSCSGSTFVRLLRPRIRSPPAYSKTVLSTGEGYQMSSYMEPKVGKIETVSPGLKASPEMRPETL